MLYPPPTRAARSASDDEGWQHVAAPEPMEGVQMAAGLPGQYKTIHNAFAVAEWDEEEIQI